MIVAPWTIRNAVELDRFVPISTGGGKALFIGTYLPGDGDHYGTKRALFYAVAPATPTSPRRRSTCCRCSRSWTRLRAERPELDRDAALGAIGKENLGDLRHRAARDLAAMMGRKVCAHVAVRLGARHGRRLAGGHPRACCASPGSPGSSCWRSGAAGRRSLIALLVLGITAIGAVLLASTRRNLILMPIVIALAGVAVSWLVAARILCRSWSPAPPSSPRSSPPS